MSPQEYGPLKWPRIDGYITIYLNNGDWEEGKVVAHTGTGYELDNGAFIDLTDVESWHYGY